MGLVVIPVLSPAMSASSEGGLNFNYQNRGIGKRNWQNQHIIGNGLLKHTKQTGNGVQLVGCSSQSNSAVVCGYNSGRLQALSVSLGETYLFHHRLSAPDCSRREVRTRVRQNEITLLKITKDCALWIQDSKHLLKELDCLFEEQCCIANDKQISPESSKLPRLLNLYERCRLHLASAGALRRKTCILSSFTRDCFASHQPLGMLWSSITIIILEMLRSISNTLVKEIELYGRTVFDPGIREVDVCKQVAEQVDNLCLLFEKYGKLSLLLRNKCLECFSRWENIANVATGANILTLLQPYCRMSMFSFLQPILIVYSSWELESVVNVNNLLGAVAIARAPLFTSFVVRMLGRLVRKKLIRRLIFSGRTGNSLSVTSSSQRGGSPQSEVDGFGTQGQGGGPDKAFYYFAKRIQRRFWYELSQLFEQEKLMITPLVNVSSSCLEKERTMKKYTSSIVRETTGNRNGMIPLQTPIVPPKGSESYGHLAVEDVSVNKEGKRVHFKDGIPPPERRDVQDYYMKRFWHEYVQRFLHVFFAMESSESELCILLRVFLDQDLANGLLTCFSPNKHVAKGDVNADLVSSMTCLITYFSTLSSVANWDNCVAKLLPLSQKDKCRLHTRDEQSQPLTKTGLSLLSSYEPLLKFVNITSKVVTHGSSDTSNIFIGNCVWDMQVKCLSVFLCHLQITTSWFCYKAQQFLASGSWELFFSVVKNDLNTVVTELEAFLSPLTLVSRSISSHSAPETYTASLLGRIQQTLQNLKDLEAESTLKLVNNIKERSTLIWGQTMPATKQWRKRGVAHVPLDPNPYVQLAATQILVPLMDAMKFLNDEEIETIFCKCVYVFLQSWMNYFLEEEIKFSYYGAHQLRLDLNYFRNWLAEERANFSSEIAAVALELNIFEEFEGAICLLCCQPQSRHRGNSEGDISTVNSTSSSSVSQGSFSSGANFEDVIREVDIPNKQHWLQLRAKGPRKARLLCLSAPE